MQRPILIVALALVSTALAQRPMRGLPMTPPPTPHPGLVGQPLIGPTGGMTGGETRSTPAPAAGCMPSGRAVDPDTTGVKLQGKALAAAVKKVTKLEWFDDFDDAKIESAATGKPIFWIQALGDIDGFA
ncbi:MAG: hypothetical protein H6838_01475 [Planctomycetes bacterium]|nr:hypothetical protein [Planctomycetota bacterium]MCB9884127.1 hypothetical protein [Planctomycetota bacterium]